MDLFSVALTLLLVFDPFGNIPAFLSILSHIPPEKRRMIIMREMFIALIILTLFLFFGKYILAAMRISEPALGIAGGIVLFLIALRMIFPGSGVNLVDRKADDPFIVPLAVPLIAGPSALTMIILFSSRYESRMMLLTALSIAWAATAVILILADALHGFLGHRFFNAMERLMGLILTTVAVQMFLEGVRDYMRTGG